MDLVVRDEPAADMAHRLNVSVAAVDLIRHSDVIDLHLDTFIAWRLVGYDFRKRHAKGPFGRHLWGHSDLPRLREGGYTGAGWSITTNPFRSAASRWRIFERNLATFRRLVDETQGAMKLVRTAGEYREARKAGAHAVFLSIQGGHALEAAPQGAASVPEQLVTRVTLVHLLSSTLGTTSSPLRIGSDAHLTERARAFVHDLNANRVFVDLAHIHPVSFRDAVEVHDRSQPLLVTHTGVSAVCPSWRNIDDDQIRAVAATGGTIGIIFQPGFLRRRGGPTDGRMIVEHMRHVMNVAGEDFVSLGSDLDGFISPPPGLTSVHELPRLVQYMLDAGIAETAIQKILGGNFLRALALLRPEESHGRAATRTA
jgi:membrane dipeptidase